MTAFYLQHDRLLLSVDCIIFGMSAEKLGVILIKRDFEPEKGKWSLMGGFVGRNESINDAARRVLNELTGLDNVYMQQLGAFGELDRDPGGRVVSIAYYALLNLDLIDRQVLEQHNAAWFEIGHLPQLGFDHPKMISDARKELCKRIITEPLVFNLLPPHFTLTGLQNIYELLLGEELDKRNFRKRVAENACIQPTELIDKSSSRRGARLHVFNTEVYETDHKFKL